MGQDNAKRRGQQQGAEISSAPEPSKAEPAPAAWQARRRFLPATCQNIVDRQHRLIRAARAMGLREHQARVLVGVVWIAGPDLLHAVSGARLRDVTDLAKTVIDRALAALVEAKVLRPRTEGIESPPRRRPGGRPTPGYYFPQRWEDIEPLIEAYNQGAARKKRAEKSTRRLEASGVIAGDTDETPATDPSGEHEAKAAHPGERKPRVPPSESRASPQAKAARPPKRKPRVPPPRESKYCEDVKDNNKDPVFGTQGSPLGQAPAGEQRAPPTARTDDASKPAGGNCSPKPEDLVAEVGRDLAEQEASGDTELVHRLCKLLGEKDHALWCKIDRLAIRQKTVCHGQRRRATELLLALAEAKARDVTLDNPAAAFTAMLRNGKRFPAFRAAWLQDESPPGQGGGRGEADRRAS